MAVVQQQELVTTPTATNYSELVSWTENAELVIERKLDCNTETGRRCSRHASLPKKRRNEES